MKRKIFLMFFSILFFITWSSHPLAAAKTPYKIGVNLELTGPWAEITKTLRNAMVLEAEKINKAGGFDYIVLGYGACGNGLDGVRAGKQPLIIPRAHDCITFFLGSMKAHLAHHEKCPGTYYLNKGWIDEKKDPLGVLDEYTERYGRKTAEWVIQTEFKNYKRMVMVTTGTFDPAQYRARAMADAEYVKLAYEEIEGSTKFITKIVRGPWKNDEFLTLKPGEEVTPHVFLEIIGCASSPA